MTVAEVETLAGKVQALTGHRTQGILHRGMHARLVVHLTEIPADLCRAAALETADAARESGHDDISLSIMCPGDDQ